MKLKEYRIKSNMTQKEVAKALNITQAGYGNYETGRTEPDINTLIKLSVLFKTSIDNLVDNTNDNIFLNYNSQNIKQKDKNTIVVYERGKGYSEQIVSDKELKIIKNLMQTMKDLPDEDNF